MTLSPVVIGLEVPGPGSFTFQRKFSLVHWTGRSLSSATPPREPRNPGQSAATREPMKADVDTRAATAKRMGQRMRHSLDATGGLGNPKATEKGMKGR